jgi:hypothetical protein
LVVAEREFAASVEALIAYRACRAFLQRAGVPIYSIFDLSSPAMGNQANLMSSFEFIAALMSIIIGLGVTNLLAGPARAFYRRKENPLDEVHIVLTVATLLLLVLQWWVTFRWNTEVNWTFDKFLVLTA